MPDFQHQQPIHPADCACPRCDPQLLGGSRRPRFFEIGLTGLIISASVVGAVYAVLGLTT